MIELRALVEGQTEATFFGEVLAPHFASREINLRAILIGTGGVSKYAPAQKQLRLLLRDQGVRLVTTMFDYYRLPKDFPGMKTQESVPPAERIVHLEAALKKDIGNSRFLPYLSRHEFEALLFSAPQRTAVFGAPVARKLKKIRQGFPGPEDIDDGKDTSPSRRIANVFPGYSKAIHGPLAATDIGLAAIRAACPHFNGWVTKLEQLS